MGLVGDWLLGGGAKYNLMRLVLRLISRPRQIHITVRPRLTELRRRLLLRQLQGRLSCPDIVLPILPADPTDRRTAIPVLYRNVKILILLFLTHVVVSVLLLKTRRHLNSRGISLPLHRLANLGYKISRSSFLLAIFGVVRPTRPLLMRLQPLHLHHILIFQIIYGIPKR